MRRFLALTLCIGLAAPGCVSLGGASTQVRPAVVTAPAGQEFMGDYARNLSAGTRVRVTTVDRWRVRGTLIKTTDTALYVQPRGRLAEPIVEIAFTNLATIERDKDGGSVGRAIALGAAAGAGAALGVFYLLVLAYSD
jgi:hypothetical protein